MQGLLTFGSLFAGVGGMDLGLERAGLCCRWQVENDNFAKQVLRKHWPNVRRWDDVRNWPRPDTEAVDLIAGGFPCHDISHAGRRCGLAGQRSGLWYEFLRILCELRPRFVLVENVAALLVRGMDEVLGGLATLGYSAEWECLPAAAFGSPHNRDRLFIVAYSSGRGEGIFQDSRERWMAQFEHQRLLSHLACQSRMEHNDRFEDEPIVARMVDGTSKPMDIDQRNRGIGNAVYPAVAEWIGRRIIEFAACEHASPQTNSEQETE